MAYQITLNRDPYHFPTLNILMGKANEDRTGDRTIGLAAESEKERVAAQTLLAELPLHTFFENPAVPYENCEVTRAVIDSVSQDAYLKIKNYSVGEFRNWLLSSKANALVDIQKGLSPEMVAATVKLCSNMDLVTIAQKLRNTSQAKFTIGRPGTLSSRLQPNHPTDSIPGITALCLEGLSYGSGDCLIGVNPALDSVESVHKIAVATRSVIDRLEIPTVNCVLAHLSTQMEALRKGAPLDILFQSIAGNEATHRQFGISLALLKEAQDLARDKHPEWPNLLYFETGQGSELSLNSHEGVDQVTLEARTYGIARIYSPYMVNNVSGFIGPEILYNGKQMIRANLEDLTMAKLLGIPMGMAPCYTTHSEIDQNDHDIATMLLTLAGTNFFMGIAQNDDVMLSYQDTSFHDVATLRELYGLNPAPEFAAWLEKRQIWSQGKRGPRFGDASVFQ